MRALVGRNVEASGKQFGNLARWSALAASIFWMVIIAQPNQIGQIFLPQVKRFAPRFQPHAKYCGIAHWFFLWGAAV